MVWGLVVCVCPAPWLALTVQAATPAPDAPPRSAPTASAATTGPALVFFLGAVSAGAELSWPVGGSAATSAAGSGATGSGATGSVAGVDDSVMSGGAPLKPCQHPARTWGFSMAQLRTLFGCSLFGASSPDRS